MKTRRHRPDLELKQAYEELKENPVHKFNLAFTLMSIIPILCFMYLLVGDLFSLEILEGNVGLVVFVAILISLLGFYIGHLQIKKMLARVMTCMVRIKESDKQKSIFVAKVSHEIKNPLSTLRLSISTILDSISENINEEQKEMFHRCKNLCDRLIRFATELLNLSKIESGSIELRRSLLEINKLISEEIKIFEPSLNRKQIKLNSNNPFPKISIWGDHDKLSLAISNIIDNAIKYTPENGKIFVSLLEENRHVRIEISDTGVGISEEKIDKIFSKFDKISSSLESTGLGLVITKDIVELHKGQIFVESKLNEGSKFTILLPKDLRKK